MLYNKYNFFPFLVYRGLLVSFSQGGTGVPCPPSLSSLSHFLSRLTALTVVFGGGGWVYVWDWGVCGVGFLL